MSGGVRLLSFTNSSEGYFSRFFFQTFFFSSIKVNTTGVVILIARRFFFCAKRLRPRAPNTKPKLAFSCLNPTL